MNLSTASGAGADVVPWPWPFAPILLAALVGIAALVVYAVYHYVIRGED